MVGLEWVAPAACVAAALAAITIALEDGLAGALPVTAVEIAVVLPPSSVVAAHHTAVEVYPLPLVDWNFATVVVMTTRGPKMSGPSFRKPRPTSVFKKGCEKARG
jgi:hypothetical protein